MIYYLQFHIYQAPTYHPTNCLYGLHHELADHYDIISFSPVYADKLPLEPCLWMHLCYALYYVIRILPLSQK